MKTKEVKNKALDWFFAALIFLVSGVFGIFIKLAIRPIANVYTPTLTDLEMAKLAAVIGAGLIVIGVMCAIKSIILYRKYRKMIGVKRKEKAERLIIRQETISEA